MGQNLLKPKTQKLETMASSDTRTLRVSGLGHTVTLNLPPSTTIADLKSEIEAKMDVPAAYQRLLARGSKLDADDVTLEASGIQDRTKIMVMHNALYAQEKEGFEALSALSKEIEDLAATKESKSPAVVSELVTRICCKLDGVDTMGSENLRALRKTLLKKAEDMETSSSNEPNEGTS